MFGYGVLWIFPFVSLLKWVMAYSCMRHMVVSGSHPLIRWNELPGSRGWLPFTMCLTAFACLPLWISFISGVLGTHCTTIFGGVATLDGIDLYLWATIWLALAAALLLMGGYALLEKIQIVILAIMLVAVFIAVIVVRPDWWAVAIGFFWPHALQYPDWVFNIVPNLRNRSEWLEVLFYTSVIGGSVEDYLGYVSFLREKKWGRSHLGEANREQLETMAHDRRHPARVWIRAALIDTVASFVSVAFIACAFAILGVAILQPAQQVPDGVELLTHQAAFLTELAPWLEPLYNLAVFMAFFGILIGVPEIGYRVLYEYFQSLLRFRDRMNLRRMRSASIAWVLGGGCLVLWISRINEDLELIDLATPAGIYTGILGCGFVCLVNPWMDRRFLPLELCMPWYLVWLNWAAGVLFVVSGIKALWDYSPVAMGGTLVGIVLCVVFAGRVLGFAHRIDD